VIRQTLRRRNQRLRDERTAIVALGQGVEWLGVRLQGRRQHWAGQSGFGYVVPDTKIGDMLARLAEMTTPPSNKIDGSAFNPARWIVSINEQLRDWRQAYLFADNAPEVFRTLDEYADERVAALLLSITGVGRAELYRQYRARLPRGFRTWEVPGARLCMLSALAPHAPAFLTRKPVWMQAQPRPAPAAKAAPAKAPAPLALPFHPEKKEVS